MDETKHINMTQQTANRRLKELREHSNLSEEDLAYHLAITPEDVIHLEMGIRPFSANLVTKTCELFRCTKDFLFGESDEMPEPVLIKTPRRKVKIIPYRQAKII